MIVMLRYTLAGGVCGLLTRPCCVVPLVLSIAGAGGNALSMVVAAHRGALQVLSVCLLATSLGMTFRGKRPWLYKAVTIAGTVIGFLVAIAGSRML